MDHSQMHNSNVMHRGMSKQDHHMMMIADFKI